MRGEARVGVLLFRSQQNDKIVIMNHYETNQNATIPVVLTD